MLLVWLQEKNVAGLWCKLKLIYGVISCQCVRPIDISKKCDVDIRCLTTYDPW
jgi:hypothetical protein